jgi:hypothetical protein
VLNIIQEYFFEIKAYLPFLRCLKEQPANVLVILLVLPLLNALLAVLATLFEVLAIVFMCLTYTTLGFN